MNSKTWRMPVVVLLCGGGVLALSMGIRQTFGLFLEPMTLALDIGRGNFALAIAVQNLIWGLLTPLVGILADRYGTARCLIFGGITYAAGILLMALGDSVLALHLGGGVLVGIAVSATSFPLVLSAVARAVPVQRRSAALGITSAGGSVGQFLLLPYTQSSIGQIGWVSTLVVLAVLSALIVPLSAALVGRPPKASTDELSIGDAVTEARQHRGYQLLCGGFFVCGFHVAFVATHLPAYISALGFEPQVGANALSAIGFFNIVGGLLAGYLGGRYRKKYLLAGIYLGRSIAIILFMTLPPTELTVWLFSASFGLMWLSTVPLTSGLVGDVFGPRYMATLFGFVMLAHQMGSFLGAWLGGISYDLTGSYGSVWFLAVVLGLIAAALHWPIADRPVAETRIRVAEEA